MHNRILESPSVLLMTEHFNNWTVRMLFLVFRINDNTMLSMLTLIVRLAMLSLYHHPGLYFLVRASCRN